MYFIKTARTDVKCSSDGLGSFGAADTTHKNNNERRANMAKPWQRGRSQWAGMSVLEKRRYNREASLAFAPTEEARAKIEAKHVADPLPPKRERIRRPVDGKPAIPLEKTILADVLQVLRLDPRVGYVWRQTSGTFMDGDRYIKAGPKGMPDVLGILKGSGRLIAIEVKRLGGKPEPHQQKLIDHFKSIGAVSGYCWSAESALALLP